jgi:hypothetical protein
MVAGVRMLAAAVAVLVLVGAPAAGAKPAKPRSPLVSFRVFARTGHNMNSVVWTGSRFLYVENTKNVVWAAPPSGLPLTQVAAMPNMVEETRCVLSPGSHGFPAGAVFCASPDEKIYELPADGSAPVLFATLPNSAPSTSDGALAWDQVGRFGYALVAATGRSGGPQPSGGIVYTIDSSGAVGQVGTYNGPGGADEVMIAPASFGSAGGDALLTVDPGSTAGAVVAMAPDGSTRTVATLPDGPNPIAAIPTSPSPTGAAAPGLYVTDDTNGYVYLLPAAQLTRFAGNVVVGTENQAHWYVLEPRGQGFAVVRLRHNLRGGHYSLEGALYVG